MSEAAEKLEVNEYTEQFGESKNGNYRAFDMNSSPHPYMITAKLVGYASDNFGGMLGNEAIEAYEGTGARCGFKNCNLTLKEHEKILLIQCDKDFNKGEDFKDECHQYLLSIKDESEAEGYAGFGFVQNFKD